MVLVRRSSSKFAKSVLNVDKNAELLFARYEEARPIWIVSKILQCASSRNAGRSSMYLACVASWTCFTVLYSVVSSERFIKYVSTTSEVGENISV